MRPVSVSVDVPQAREDVFAYLDVLANHETFTNHVLVEWQYAGPDRGVGAKARVKVKLGGRTELVDFEVVAAEPPTTIVERNVGAKGRRVATGTYRLSPAPTGGTHIEFEYAWERAPVSERLAAPLVRATLRRANERAMHRLAERLAAR
jgi:Polyketide cyclase / dehydrase and lipid transport